MGYLELLRVRYAARLLAGTLLGRLPYATAPLAIVLFTRAEGGSYALAGALAAAYGLATAVGQPLLGRLADLHGQPRVMLPAALASAGCMALLALCGTEPAAPAAAAILLGGLTTPPLEGGLRALWPGVLGREERVQRAYALDAVAQEVMFAAGPLLLMLLVSRWSEAAALLVVNAVGVAGALWVVASPPSRRWRSAPRAAHWLGALRSSVLRTLLACFFFVGLALGAISVAAVAYADDRGEPLISSWLLSALAAGALAGGLGYGARQWPGAPEGRLRLLVAALAAGYLPLALAPGPVVLMTLLAGLSGVFLAPALACAFVVIDRHAPRGTVTEAFSWLVTTFGVGSAAGTAVVGPVLEAAGPAGGFAVAGAAGLVAAAVLAAARRPPAAPGGGSRPVAAGRPGHPASLPVAGVPDPPPPGK
ncbi:Predicted arabinose efflux permease, MFS family [Streptomyces aidingensis]|uniref:Predicted arabinose efflux permease, MFS family n=1 Tax=Streptomyces aidingensis TaxID=910347 RepID=A0A1I1RZQ2_9ACTN|nr:Predicted arabinose efflux permease, MFS family [Streptomyces aidingensis]